MPPLRPTLVQAWGWAVGPLHLAPHSVRAHPLISTSCIYPESSFPLSPLVEPMFKPPFPLAQTTTETAQLSP